MSIERTHEQGQGEKNPSSIWGIYEKQSDLIEKATVAFAAKHGFQTYGRGSLYVDSRMYPEADLPGIKGRRNIIRIPSDLHGMRYAGPDLYPDVLGPNMRVRTDDASFISNLNDALVEGLGFAASLVRPLELNNVKSWKRKLPGFEAAWERDKPSDEITISHEILSHDPPIPVLRHTLLTDIFGVYGPDYGVRRHKSKDMNVTLAAIRSKPDRRHPDRCFTFDGKHVALSLDKDLVDQMDFTPQGRDRTLALLAQATLQREYPKKSRYSGLNREAQRYYGTEIPKGNKEAADEFIEALIREQRKINVSGGQFHPNILPFVRSLMHVAGPLWQQARHHATSLEGYQGDLMVAGEIDPIGALRNLHITGLYRIFAPEVQQVFRDPRALHEVERRITKRMNRTGFAHAATKLTERWYALNHSIADLIWPNRVLAPVGASRLLRPVDNGSSFTPWVE